jgi:hypothetical protein
MMNVSIRTVAIRSSGWSTKTVARMINVDLTCQGESAGR